MRISSQCKHLMGIGLITGLALACGPDSVNAQARSAAIRIQVWHTETNSRSREAKGNTEGLRPVVM